MREYKQSFIIKPSGGSGGAGVMPISEFEAPSNIRKIIKESKEEFFAKFMKTRNPFPYTIQEKADFSLCRLYNVCFPFKKAKAVGGFDETQKAFIHFHMVSYFYMLWRSCKIVKLFTMRS